MGENLDDCVLNQVYHSVKLDYNGLWLHAFILIA